ncbi:hypothetical protein [Streptomyces sp. NPDC006274]|uniref:hypothetical protein n=1 Tax=unclassified Streptomyces TaxID=2593676 RepID=UPI0033B42732
MARRLPPGGADITPAAPGPDASSPARARTAPGPGISAGTPVAVLPDLSLHPLGTRSRPAAALKSS